MDPATYRGYRSPATGWACGSRTRTTLLVVPFVLDVAEIGRGELIELVTATLALLERCYRERPPTSDR